MDIDKISALAAKIKTPLALSGLVFAVLYGIYHQVLSLNVFSNIGSSSTFALLQNVLGKLFWLALVALILGVASYIAVPILNRRGQRKSSSVALLDASIMDDDEVDNPAAAPYERWPFVFPSVDFKFQNTGSATACVWRYEISVLDAGIDRTPVLAFYYDVDGGKLRIKSCNSGWGTANRCEVALKSDVLGSLYSAEEMRACSNIPDGDNLYTPVLDLPAKSLSEDAFNLIKERHAKISGRYYQRDCERVAEEDVVPVGSLRVDWKCVDDSGGIHKGSCPVYGLGCDSLLLTRTGLRFERKSSSSPCGAAMPPGPKYRAIIEDLTGRPHACVGSISRQIPPGDLERFSIVIGARMSCSLVLKFKFFIDTSDIIESKRFEIRIWNPRGNEWQYEYWDRAEFAVSENDPDPSSMVPKFEK